MSKKVRNIIGFASLMLLITTITVNMIMSKVRYNNSISPELEQYYNVDLGSNECFQGKPTEENILNWIDGTSWIHVYTRSNRLEADRLDFRNGVVKRYYAEDNYTDWRLLDDDLDYWYEDGCINWVKEAVHPDGRAISELNVYYSFNPQTGMWFMQLGDGESEHQYVRYYPERRKHKKERRRGWREEEVAPEDTLATVEEWCEEALEEWGEDVVEVSCEATAEECFEAEY